MFHRVEELERQLNEEKKMHDEYLAMKSSSEMYQHQAQLLTDEVICIDMHTGMCVDMRADMCINMCMDTCIDMHVDMRTQIQ